MTNILSFIDFKIDVNLDSFIDNIYDVYLDPSIGYNVNLNNGIWNATDYGTINETMLTIKNTLIDGINIISYTFVDNSITYTLNVIWEKMIASIIDITCGEIITVNRGDAITLTSGLDESFASNGTYIYQWYSYDNGVFNTISGATDATFIFDVSEYTQILGVVTWTSNDLVQFTQTSHCNVLIDNNFTIDLQYVDNNVSSQANINYRNTVDSSYICTDVNSASTTGYFNLICTFETYNPDSFTIQYSSDGITWDIFSEEQEWSSNILIQPLYSGFYRVVDNNDILYPTNGFWINKQTALIVHGLINGVETDLNGLNILTNELYEINGTITGGYPNHYQYSINDLLYQLDNSNTFVKNISGAVNMYSMGEECNSICSYGSYPECIKSEIINFNVISPSNKVLIPYYSGKTENQIVGDTVYLISGNLLVIKYPSTTINGLNLTVIQGSNEPITLNLTYSDGYAISSLEITNADFDTNFIFTLSDSNSVTPLNPNYTTTCQVNVKQAEANLFFTDNNKQLIIAEYNNRYNNITNVGITVISNFGTQDDISYLILNGLGAQLVVTNDIFIPQNESYYTVRIIVAGITSDTKYLVLFSNITGTISFNNASYEYITLGDTYSFQDDLDISIASKTRSSYAGYTVKCTYNNIIQTSVVDTTDYTFSFTNNVVNEKLPVVITILNSNNITVLTGTYYIFTFSIDALLKESCNGSNIYINESMSTNVSINNEIATDLIYSWTGTVNGIEFAEQNESSFNFTDLGEYSISLTVTISSETLDAMFNVSGNYSEDDYSTTISSTVYYTSIDYGTISIVADDTQNYMNGDIIYNMVYGDNFLYKQSLITLLTLSNSNISMTINDGTINYIVNDLQVSNIDNEYYVDTEINIMSTELDVSKTWTLTLDVNEGDCSLPKSVILIYKSESLFYINCVSTVRNQEIIINNPSVLVGSIIDLSNLDEIPSSVNVEINNDTDTLFNKSVVLNNGVAKVILGKKQITSNQILQLIITSIDDTITYDTISITIIVN